MLRPSLPRRTRLWECASLLQHSHPRLNHTIWFTTNGTASLLFYYFISQRITQYYTLNPSADKVKTRWKKPYICWCWSVDKDLRQHLSKGLWEWRLWAQRICILTCVRVCVSVCVTDWASTLGGICLLFQLQRHLQQAILLSYERTGQHKAVASHSQVLQWVIP